MKTISKNPIPRNGLFSEKTLSELQEYIEQMSAKEKAFAYMIMTMTMNSCHRLVNEAEVNADQEACPACGEDGGTQCGSANCSY